MTGLTLPAHVTEDDVRAVAEMIVPDAMDQGWNAALEATTRGLTALEDRGMLTLSNALDIIESIRRPDGEVSDDRTGVRA